MKQCHWCHSERVVFASDDGHSWECEACGAVWSVESLDYISRCPDCQNTRFTANTTRPGFDWECLECGAMWAAVESGELPPLKPRNLSDDAIREIIQRYPELNIGEDAENLAHYRRLETEGFARMVETRERLDLAERTRYFTEVDNRQPLPWAVRRQIYEGPSELIVRCAAEAEAKALCQWMLGDFTPLIWVRPDEFGAFSEDCMYVFKTERGARAMSAVLLAGVEGTDALFNRIKEAFDK